MERTYARYKIFTQIANFNYANNFERMEDFFFGIKKNSYVSPILSCSLIYLGILFAFHFIFAISQLIFVHVDE